VTPNAKRLLRVAAESRRRVATRRWFAFTAGISEDASRAALVELSKAGRVSRREGEIFDILSTDMDDE
jgi:hypothetical protein